MSAESLPYLRSYVAPEDAARAFAPALTVDCAGYDLFRLSAADTFIAEPTLDYLRGAQRAMN